MILSSSQGLIAMCIQEKESWAESFAPEFSPGVT
jgi:hypothetical protein